MANTVYLKAREGEWLDYVRLNIAVGTWGLLNIINI